MLIFSNQGVLDLRALTTFGINSKENASAIGQFGTGLKYAIALLVRLGHKVIIYNGLKKIADRVEYSKQNDSHIYYKSVRANHFAFGMRSRYCYNISRDLTLTEDRTIDVYYAKCIIAHDILQCDDEELIRDALLSRSPEFESYLDFDVFIDTPRISATFVATIEKLMKTNSKNINNSAIKLYKRHFKNRFNPANFKLSRVQKEQFNRAKRLCKFLNFPVQKFPIVFVESLETNDTFGLAVTYEGTQTIYISRRVFDVGGAKMLASVLIEEYLHLELGFADESREMQNYLFERLVAVGEEFSGVAL